MTTITVYRWEVGTIAGYRAEGHAQSSARRGGDIVCSAVSALTQTGVNAVEAIAGVPTKPTIDDGLLEFILPRELSDKQEADCQIILRTVVQGLTDIEHSYPTKVRVVYKEWREKHA